MKTTRGLTLAELLVTVLVVAVLGTVLILVLRHRARTARVYRGRIRCRNDLNQLAKGVYTYLNEHGDNRWLPCPLGRGARPDDYSGAEWLASLYWTGIVPDPYVFVCPGTEDENDEGRDIGTHRIAATFGSQTVSYAAMHYRSLTDASGQTMPGAIRDEFPPNLPMACDDTEGTINHGDATYGAMNVLFFDTHVEFKVSPDIDIERGVGKKGGLLWQLRN